MKKQFLSQLVGTGIITLGTLTALSPLSQAQSSQPSQPQPTTFYCELGNGMPTTMAITPRGKVPIIRWFSTYFTGSGYTPERRCQEVSVRFQTYYNNNTLNYVTTGVINNQPVVCVTSTSGGGCQRLLFTLKRGQDASRTLQQLFDVRAGASGPLYESSGGSKTNTYIDMNNLLQTAPVESSASPSTQPVPTPNSNPPGPGSREGIW